MLALKQNGFFFSLVEIYQLIVLFGKFSQYKSSRQTHKGTEGETNVVDRVALCSDRNNNMCIKFMIRHTRRPEVNCCQTDDFLNMKCLKKSRIK